MLICVNILLCDIKLYACACMCMRGCGVVCVCVCVCVCMCVGGWVGGCPCVHAHFVYMNINKVGRIVCTASHM